MTTITATTTTAATTTINSSSTKPYSRNSSNNNNNNNNNNNSNNNNNKLGTVSNSSNPKHSVGGGPLETHLDSFKAFVNRTFATVSEANSNESPDNSTSTVQYSKLPSFVASHVPGSEVSATLVADMVTAAATTLPTVATHHLTETSTAFPAQTVATFIAGNKNRATAIIVYPTVSPESIVIPIVSCIFGFPILALLVICCLRRRAKLARERDRRRNYDMQDHAVSLVRFSPIHRLNYRSSRAISLRPERSMSQGFTSLELDTVMEERCSDVEQTQTEILNAESPMDTTSYKMSFSS